MCRKIKTTAVSLSGGGGSASNTMWHGQWQSGILIHPAVWPQHMGRNVGGCCAPPFSGGIGSPSNRMSSGLRPTFVPSGILIHPAVWPQQTGQKLGVCPSVAGAEAYLYAKFHLDPSNRLTTIHQRYRQTGQRSDSIGRTVLETVAQK